jgi:hypothetical protein
MGKWLDLLARKINPPPFQVGDVVRFEPDERALGWTQELEGLYPGYVGKVTKIKRGRMFEWDVYVDNKTVGFLSIYFKLIKRARE